MLTPAQRRFVESQRTAALATIDVEGRPRLVPICFALSPSGAAIEELWSPLDEKPKSSSDPLALARVRDIERRPDVSLLFDRWDEDWTRLGWLRLGGTASILGWAGSDRSRHAAAVDRLRSRYPQYGSQALESRPIISIRIVSVRGWAAAIDPDPDHHLGDQT